MLKMDALILAKKIYDMMNRIAVSDGSYQAWQEVIYDEKALRIAESPMYVGGMPSEIVFDEIVSNSATENQPLGTLAGRDGVIWTKEELTNKIYKSYGTDTIEQKEIYGTIVHTIRRIGKVQEAPQQFRLF